MLILIYLLSFMLNLLVIAIPIDDVDIKYSTELTKAGNEKALAPRQIVSEGASVTCCDNCGGAYDYSTFWHAFNNLCTWAGDGLELWSNETYYTGSYYCDQSSGACIHMEIQFLCYNSNGNGYAAPVDYDGCMGYFQYVVWPPHRCGGSPYPGAHVQTPDGCWVFQATADSGFESNINMALVALECDETGHICTKPGSNQTVDTYAGPEHHFE